MFSNAVLALGLRAYFARQNKLLAEAERQRDTLGLELSGYGKSQPATELEGTLGYRFVL